MSDTPDLSAIREREAAGSAALYANLLEGERGEIAGYPSRHHKALSVVERDIIAAFIIDADRDRAALLRHADAQAARIEELEAENKILRRSVLWGTKVINSLSNQLRAFLLTGTCPVEEVHAGLEANRQYKECAEQLQVFADKEDAARAALTPTPEAP